MINRIDGPFSVYLDAARLLAASAVFLGHAHQVGISGSQYVLGGFAHEAVIVFFVLSGLVIRATVHDEPQRYAIARLARILSVAVPALLLAVACRQFVSGFSLADLSALWRAGLFLGESWLPRVLVPANNPYWSITYEVWYYVAFGLWWYGYRRSAVVAGVVAGPSIILLLPIWLLGCRLATMDVRPNRVAGAVLLALSVAVFAGIHYSGIDWAIQGWLKATGLPMWRLGASQRFLTDYVLGLAVAANFIGFKMLAPSHIPFAGGIKTAAGLTFSLYLFHFPLMELAKVTGYGTLPVLMGCVALGLVTERNGPWLRRMILSQVSASRVVFSVAK